MLARVHGQCGWANINSVGLFGCRGTTDTAGHFEAILPTCPGVASYWKSARPPKARAAIQVAPTDRRYVRMAVGFGVVVWRVIPELVDEAEAKQEMAGLAYTGAAAK